MPGPVARAERGLPGMCTLHANSAREALVKMCTLPLLAGANTEWGSREHQMVTRKVWRFGHALVTDSVTAAESQL